MYEEPSIKGVSTQELFDDRSLRKDNKYLLTNTEIDYLRITSKSTSINNLERPQN